MSLRPFVAAWAAEAEVAPWVPPVTTGVAVLLGATLTVMMAHARAAQLRFNVRLGGSQGLWVCRGDAFSDAAAPLALRTGAGGARRGLRSCGLRCGAGDARGTRQRAAGAAAAAGRARAGRTANGARANAQRNALNSEPRVWRALTR